MPERVKIKYCRHCGRIIPLDSAECPYCDRVVIREHEQKLCPFCGEAVKAAAIKCKHCGEFLDGRPSAAPGRQQILHIEKAIIASPDARGEVQLLRPDGQPLDANELGPTARGELPAAPAARKALPAAADERSQAAGLPAKLPAARTRLPSKPIAGPPAAAKAPPVELECPSCNRTVFEADHYCENCGRDLALPRDYRTIRPAARPYDTTDHALILSSAAPAGLLLPPPYSGLIAAAGAALGAWCAVRIATSGGTLKGIRRALWAIGLGLFWLATIFVVKGL